MKLTSPSLMPRGVIKLCSPCPFVGYRVKYTPLQSNKNLELIKKTFPELLRKILRYKKISTSSPCPSVGYRDKKTYLLHVLTSPSPFVGHREKKETYQSVRYASPSPWVGPSNYIAAFFQKGELGGVLARLS